MVFPLLTVTLEGFHESLQVETSSLHLISLNQKRSARLLCPLSFQENVHTRHDDQLISLRSESQELHFVLPVKPIN